MRLVGVEVSPRRRRAQGEMSNRAAGNRAGRDLVRVRPDSGDRGDGRRRYKLEWCEVVHELDDARLRGVRTTVRWVDDDSGDGLESLEQRIVDTTFIVEELLAIAAYLDYTDEIGRRKMFSIVRG